MQLAATQAQPKQAMHMRLCLITSSICPVCMQESWVQSAAVRAVQAQPKQAMHRQLCAQVLGGGQAVGQMRRGDPSGASGWHDWGACC